MGGDWVGQREEEEGNERERILLCTLYCTFLSISQVIYSRIVRICRVRLAVFSLPLWYWACMLKYCVVGSLIPRHNLGPGNEANELLCSASKIIRQ